MTRSGMTVGELRLALDGVPDDIDVTVRASRDDGDSICGGVCYASVSSFCIDASDDLATLQDADSTRRRDA